MDWFIDIFTQQTFIQGVVVLALICAVGLALGNIKVFGVSLGVTFVFFSGILAGHLGLAINPDMLSIMQNFGLVLFIYSLGVQVGPGFFSAFKKGGVKLNLLALSVLVLDDTYPAYGHDRSAVWRGYQHAYARCGPAGPAPDTPRRLRDC